MSAADGREHTPLFYHPLFETANVKMTRLYTYIVEMGGGERQTVQTTRREPTNEHTFF